MAARALYNDTHALVHTFLAGAAIAGDMTPVKFGADDLHVVACDSNDVGFIGWSRHAVTAAEQACAVMLNGNSIIKVTVAAASTATRGKFAIGVTSATTYKDAPTIGGGSTLAAVQGKFLQDGVAGDVVGLLVGGVNSYALTT